MKPSMEFVKDTSFTLALSPTNTTDSMLASAMQSC